MVLFYNRVPSWFESCPMDMIFTGMCSSCPSRQVPPGQHILGSRIRLPTQDDHKVVWSWTSGSHATSPSPLEGRHVSSGSCVVLHSFADIAGDLHPVHIAKRAPKSRATPQG